MCAGLQEEQRQLGVVLLPGHQPVGLDVALPNALQVARQAVRTVLLGQRAFGGKDFDGLADEVHLEAALLAELDLLAETRGEVYRVFHIAMPISLKKSPTES